MFLVILFCEKCAENVRVSEKGLWRSGTGLLCVLALIVLGIVGIVLRLWIATAWSLIVATVSGLAIAGGPSTRITAVAWLRGSIACILGTQGSQGGLPDLGTAPRRNVRTVGCDIADSTSP